MNQKALVPLQQRLVSLRHVLETKKMSLASVLPKHMTPERMIKISLVAASRNPQLLNCSPESFLGALMDASELGLEPFSGLNYSYIIPYRNNRTGTTEAKFMPSYRGLMELARRSGQIKSLDADIVYEHDKWEVEKGLNPKLVHVPNFHVKDRGKPILVYAIAKFKDDGYQFRVMTIEEIEKTRKSSKSSNSGPWVDWWDQMALKTCLKSLLKHCPMSTELAEVVAKDNITDHGDLNIDYIDPNDVPEIDEEKASKMETKSEDLVERLAGLTKDA